MPRNGTGTYTLPRPAFIPGTVISSSDVNADFSDIATALTGSLAANGETPLTGQLRGVASVLPTYSYAGDADTGWGSNSADTLYGMVGGTQRLVISTTGIAVTGAAIFSGAVTVSSGGITVIAGGVTISSGNLAVSGLVAVAGNSTITGTLSVTGIPSFTSTSHMVLPKGATGDRPAGTAGFFRYNTTLNFTEYFNGTTWVSEATLPTIQVLTSGTGATYNTPTGCRQLRIRMVGGGGGGGADNTNNGANGTASVFNSIAAAFGVGGSADTTTGAAGGSGGAGSATFRIDGGNGGGPTCTQNSFCGGAGGVSNFGGSGAAALNAAGGAAKANSGSGGAGGGGGSGAGGGGGGAGEYLELIINSPAASYTYTVGAGGNGGAAGGRAGGNGGTGLIIVHEFY